jgi:hypothetical protein
MVSRTDEGAVLREIVERISSRTFSLITVASKKGDWS